MSLINQMLRDLDARRAPAADRAQLQNAVHAAPRRPARLLSVFGLVAVGVALAGAGAWYWLTGRAQPAPQVQAIPAPQPAPQAGQPAAAAAAAAPAVVAAANAPVVAPAVAMTAPAAAAGEPPAPAPKPAASAKPARIPPGGATAGKRAPIPAPPAAVPLAAAPTVPAAPETAHASAAKAVAVPPAESSIEKRPRTPLSNEAAENEYNKAIVALRRGATAEAITSLQLALRLDVLHVSARQALLSLLLRQQQWGEAQAVAEEGLAVDPTQTGWAIALARLQMEHGKLGEASETLARHARYADRNADYQAFQALLLQKQKRHREASDRYIAAVSLRPGEARWWYGLGISLEADQRMQEAREAFTKARDAGNLPPELAGSLKYHLR